MKRNSLYRLTREQQLMLATIKMQDWSEVPWPREPGRTQASLLRRGLISQKELPKHTEFVALGLTEEGEKVVASRSPVKWVRYLLSQGHHAVFFVQQVPLEALPEFLTHKSFGVRFFAMKRMKELADE